MFVVGEENFSIKTEEYVLNREKKYERWLPKKSSLETEGEYLNNKEIVTTKISSKEEDKLNFRKIIHMPFKFVADLLRKLMDILFREIKKNINWTTKRVQKQTENKLNSMKKQTDSKLNSMKKQLVEIQSALNKYMFDSRLLPLCNGEKLRILFLFQVASFWPCWESFYHECKSDKRFEVAFIWLKTENDNKEKTTQMESSRDFLDKLGIPFLDYDDFILDEFKPHVVVIQTPYDRGHRKAHTWSEAFQRRGIRVVYIPYGIEIADTNHARSCHFEQNLILNSWRIYTFSPRMQYDYIKYSLNGVAVRSVGIPKFDNFYNRENYPLNKEITNRRQGRKIILWKVHFPKTVLEKGKKVTVTPSIDEYLAFAEFVRNTPEYFFIFMPHPKFCDENGDPETQRKAIALVETLSNMENVYVDMADDYRPSLMHADYIMADRSAVIIEAGALGVPILYMNNDKFIEPMTEAVKPLIESYYEGNSCEDMINFVKMCSENYDPRKELRKEAFHQCVPFFDGKNGWRIKEDIYNSVLMESKRIQHSLENERIIQLEEEFRALEVKVSQFFDEKI